MFENKWNVRIDFYERAFVFMCKGSGLQQCWVREVSIFANVRS